MSKAKFRPSELIVPDVDQSSWKVEGDGRLVMGSDHMRIQITDKGVTEIQKDKENSKDSKERTPRGHVERDGEGTSKYTMRHSPPIRERERDDSEFSSLSSTSSSSFSTSSASPPSPSPSPIDSNVNPSSLILQSKLGEGNSSVVHRAFHTEWNLGVAVKTINIFDRNKRHQIMKELQALYKADCPFLIKFYGAFFKEGAISIVLELMDAGSLSDLLKVIKDRRIPELQLAFFSRQLLEGLSYLRRRHQIHRDIKPSNICLNTEGMMKFTDFGITAQLEDTVVGAQSFVGTSAYMSPERILGEKYDYSSDIWSLGLTLLECAMGRYPFPITDNYLEMMTTLVNGPSPAIPTDAPYSSDFRQFITSCLNKTPDGRPSADDLLQSRWISRWSNRMSQQEVIEWIAPYVQKIAERMQKENDGHETPSLGYSSTPSVTLSAPFSPLSPPQLYHSVSSPAPSSSSSSRLGNRRSTNESLSLPQQLTVTRIRENPLDKTQPKDAF